MRAHPEIHALLAELLDSGVSPKYVSRLASELEDHCCDLEAEAKRLGVPEHAAAADAQLRLGASSVIASEFARRPELKSWIYTSSWVVWVLRLIGAVYLLISAPARAVAAGQGVMLRYTAATAAGSSVTCAILLMLTTTMSPDSPWGARLAERAGAVLGAWEQDRTTRRRPRESFSTADDDGSFRDSRPGTAAPAKDPLETRRPAAPAPAPSEPAAPGRTAELRDSGSTLIEPGGEPRPSSPPWPAASPPTRLLSASAPIFDFSKARITLEDLPPAVHLGIDDQDFRPIVEAPPAYPSTAARRGLEGYVVVEYTVTRTGTVDEAVVVESSNSLFNRAALEAANAFKYRPRTIQGHAIDVRGVRTLIRFELEV